jgi:chemotaxis protein MotB
MTVALFLILLTFFVLLCSIAVIDEEKTRVAIGSLIGSFGSLPKGLSPLEHGKIRHASVGAHCGRGLGH